MSSVRDRLRRHRPFAVFSASTALVLAAIAGGYALSAATVLERAAEGEGFETIGRVLRARGASDLEAMRMQADDLLATLISCSLAAYGLVASIYALVRSGVRRRWIPLALAGYWLAFETCASPPLARGLGLRNYYFVTDVDHLPIDGNSDNVRSEREAQEYGEEDFNIVFLGDSFTYGLRVEREQTFAHGVERILNAALSERGLGGRVSTINFGWASSSPLLSLRRLQHIGAKYHPDLVALCVDMTDFHDDIKYASMLQRRGVYWLYDKIPLTLKVIDEVLPRVSRKLRRWTNADLPEQRFFASAAPLEETRPYFAPLVENVGRIDEWCGERDIPFVLFVLPRAYQYSADESPDNWEAARYSVLGPYSHEPFRFFDELRSRVEFPIHSLLPAFQATAVFPTCFRDDPHWTPAGHDVAAEAIAVALQAQVLEQLVR